MVRSITITSVLAALVISVSASVAQAVTQELLVSGIDGASGSTIGPGGALFVTEAVTGKILKVDPQTGDVAEFATGLPSRLPWIPIGGVVDVAFQGGTAYALVTLVGLDVGGSAVSGIYRIDGPSSATVVADLGTWSVNNPPNTAFFVPGGVQWAIETYRGGFLVSDGHHNRVLRVSRDGDISQILTLGNTVPTGMAISGNSVYVAEAGPVPHLPEDGRVISFAANGTGTEVVASGAELVLDVEFGRGRMLYGLAQGTWDGVGEGSPAFPNDGALLQINSDGSFTVVVDGLDQPTSMEFIGNTAFVVTLSGEIWRLDDVSTAPFGKAKGR